MLTTALPQLPVHFMDAVAEVLAVLAVLPADMPLPPQAVSSSAKQHPTTIDSPRVPRRADSGN
jgi:hypothetical protein